MNNIVRPKNYIARRKIKEPQLKIAREIIDIVNCYFEVELLTKGRKQLYTLPRQIAQYLIKEYCNELVEKDIATITMVKSHVTVRHSVQKIKDFIEFDIEVKQDVKLLKNEINAKIDLSKTSKSLHYRKSNELDIIRLKMLKLDNVKYFDLVDVINNHLKNYEWKA